MCVGGREMHDAQLGFEMHDYTEKDLEEMQGWATQDYLYTQDYTDLPRIFSRENHETFQSD